MLPGSDTRPDRCIRAATIPFFLVHLIPLALIVTGVTTRAVALFVVLYVMRAFFITAGYHRYFAHRAFRMGRVAQFLFAFGGGTAAQKGALWWASNHRTHHRYTDTDRDPHSPLRGFWWSHVGWILSDRFAATDYEIIEDFAKYPELRWLNKHDWVPPWTLGVASFLIGGWSGLVLGFFCSTILLWHATFAINSVAHLVGFRAYATNDSSRNNVILAVATLGEGWHNNHHHDPLSARQGFRWWQIDITYQVLRVLRRLHVVHDLRQPRAAALKARRISLGNFDVGLMRYHLARAAKVAGRAAHRDQIVQALEATAQQITTLARQRPDRAADDVPHVGPQQDPPVSVAT